MAAADESLVFLRPAVKQYAWGIRGADSRVARFAQASGALDEIDPGAPYAELWLGTHPSGPATAADGRPLEDLCGGQLPFLVKVLSAGKALSIQAHPDKASAERLHAENPEQYKDANHKPEMAIALTAFEAMCGFRALSEIAELMQRHREFTACVDPDATLAVFMALDSDEATQKAALRDLFASFMRCDPAVATRQLALLLERLRQEDAGERASPANEPAWKTRTARAMSRLAQQFPGDPGAMAPIFLNYMLIPPGESFFMAANEPHAYIEGEIVEIMACSDNVVRAGLTPKFKDVQNLVSLLTYNMGTPDVNPGVPCDDSRVRRFTPPVPEFEAQMVTVAPGDTVPLPPLATPAVCVPISGLGTVAAGPSLADVVVGRVFFVPAAAPGLQFAVPDAQTGPMKVIVCTTNQHAGL